MSDHMQLHGPGRERDPAPGFIDRLGFRALSVCTGGGIVFSLLCLLWLLLRSGRRPYRMSYPCQKFAASQCGWLFAGASVPFALNAPFAHAGIRGMSGGKPRRYVVMALACVVLAGAVAYSALGGLAGGAGPKPRSAGQMAAAASSLEVTPRAGGATGASKVFVLQDLTEEKASGGVQALIGMMASEGKKFYRSSQTRGDCGPEGIIASNDVVLVKVNGCFDERGMTNTDVIKGLITCIVNHPDGFTGEVVIVENRQLAPAVLDSSDKNNAVDRRQSFLDVAKMHSGSHRVSALDWTAIRERVVKEYSTGDVRDGYVKDSSHDITYPKFATVYGTRISLKQGVWNGSAYDNGRLKLINAPVLKSHVYAGVTAATKLYMGLWSTALTGKSWEGYHIDIIKTGGLGRVMAYGRFPSLNIMDAVWINPDLYAGPDSTFGAAVQTAKLLASADPIALDYYASKRVLLPVSVMRATIRTTRTPRTPAAVTTTQTAPRATAIRTTPSTRCCRVRLAT